MGTPVSILNRSYRYVNELTERIKVKSTTDDEEEGEGTQFMQFFPNFVWTVRDFTLQLEIDGREITPDEYLENSLRLKKGDFDYYKQGSLRPRC